MFSRLFTLLNVCLSGSSTTTNNNAVIAGGGLAGLSTAIALGPLEQNVKVLEACSKADFENESAGAAVQLTPNGLRALQLLPGGKDMLRKILDQSCEITHDVAIFPSSDKLFDNIKLSESASDAGALPTVMIRWGLLRKILAEKVPSEAMVFDQKVVSFNDETAELELQSGTSIADMIGSSSKDMEPTLIVAADGKDSIFRPTPLESTRRVNFKAVVPTTEPPASLRRVPSETQAAGTTFSFFSPTGSVACFLGPAGPNWSYTYWAISVQIADDDKDADMAFYERHVGQADSAIVLKEKLLRTLQDQKLKECQVYVDLIAQTDAESMYVELSAQAELPDSFVHATSSNAAVLVGDAAHTMTASYGQAASFALEDAVTLAHCLRQPQTTTALALEEYSRLRRQRCLKMQRLSQERVAKSIKGESVDDITAWIHDFQLDKETTTSS